MRPLARGGEDDTGHVERQGIRAASDPAIRAYLSTKQPITGGPGTAEDCAQAALYLCEPASRFLTGVVLNVDGGWCISEGQLPPTIRPEPALELRNPDE